MALRIAGVGSTTWTSGAFSGGAATVQADEVVVPTGASLTISAANTVLCRSISVTGTGTLIFAAVTSVANVGDATAGTGNIALLVDATSTITLTGIGTINLISTSATTQTIDSGGKTLPNITVNGAGSSYQLAAALTSTGNLTVTSGAFDTNGQTVVVSGILSTGALARSISFGASNFTTTSTNTPFNFSGTNLTFNAGTSTVTSAPVTNALPGNAATGYTLYDVVLTGTSDNRISVGNTFRSITLNGGASKTVRLLFVGGAGTATITNALTVNGNSTINRVLIANVTRGSTATLVSNGANTFSNVDFMDITGSGSASWNLASITGNSGDSGGNSNITFTAPSTQTATGTGNMIWSTHAWSGSPARVPLPQDDVIIPNSFIPTQSISVDMPRMGKNVTVTATGNPTWVQSATSDIYGSFQLASGMTTANANSITFSGRGSHTITTNGVTLINTPVINAPGGTFTLQDAFTASTALSLTTGTLNTNNMTVTTSTFVCTGTATRSLIMGTSTWNLTATTGTVWNTAAAGWTFSGLSSTIAIATASASTRLFATSGQTYGIINYTVAASTGTLSFTGSCTFSAPINVSGGTRSVFFAATGVYTLTATAFLNFVGTAGNLITFSSTTGGQTVRFTKASGGTMSLTSDYLSVQDIVSEQPLSMFMGANSTNVSGNIGVIFTAPGTYRFKQSVAQPSVAGTSTTATYLTPTTAGNLLIAYYYSSGSTGVLTPPTGWSIAVTATQTGVLYMFYKVATGAETTVNVSQITSRTLLLTVSEYSGFVGTPTLDVTDSNVAALSGTSLSTNAAVAPTNTDQPALALAMMGNPGTLGATVSLTNSFVEDRTLTTSSTLYKGAARELTTLAAVSTTFTWTTARTNSAAGLAVFKNVGVAASSSSFFLYF